MKPFQNVIGQSRVIRELEFRLAGFEFSGVFKNTLLSARTSAGKTHLSKTLATQISLKHKKRGHVCPVINITGKSLTTPDIFFENIVLRYLNPDQYLCLFIDEIHGIGKGVADMFLTMLEFDKNHESDYLFQNYGIRHSFNSKRFTVIGATTESHLLMDTFRNRFREVHLEDYTKEELTKILMLNVKTEITEDAAAFLVEFGRNDCRCLVDLANNVDIYVNINNLKKFEIQHTLPLLRIFNIFPMGLKQTEIKILKMLRDGPMRLTDLCSTSKLTKSEGQDVERFLVSKRLIQIDGLREITNIGYNYLTKVLPDWEKI